eukprot:scaffold495_cov157-Alexandrium_tamarense.AAC.2
MALPHKSVAPMDKMVILSKYIKSLANAGRWNIRRTNYILLFVVSQARVSNVQLSIHLVIFSK